MSGITEFLVHLEARGIIGEDDSSVLLRQYRGDSLALLRRLSKNGFHSREEIGRIWGDVIGFAYVALDKIMFQHQVVEMLPKEFALKNNIILLYKFGDAVTAAVSDPGNQSVLGGAKRITGSEISPVFAFPDEIEDAIDIQYQSRDSVKELSGKIPINEFAQDGAEVSLERLKRVAGNEAVIEFTRGLLLMAIKERASDIHIDPHEHTVRVRFRIDGVLQERLKLNKAFLAPLVSRLKVIAGADIVEKRRPQDGRISLELSNRSIDFRFSCVPTIHGEKVVLRILGHVVGKDVPDLGELSFSHSSLSTLKRVIESPNGVFFVTGPTGSGKTTTLYAVLKELNKPGVNIMTVEDPVEYRLPGINQVQVNTAIDLNFSGVLRSFLRQDPNVILVGEIRDVESAKIAAQAALTGHLVMSTMHTNNSLQAITRLVEIGVEPFLVAPSIIGVMAQRLVRRICEGCKEEYRLSKGEVDELFITNGKPEVYFFRGRGCPQCNQTGYYGRLAIHELFIINAEIRGLIAKGASILSIQKRARKHGFKSMRYDGIKKVLRGLTTIEEVDRVTIAEDEM